MNKKLIASLIALFGFVLFCTAIYLAIKRNVDDVVENKAPSPTPVVIPTLKSTPTPTPIPTPTPTPKPKSTVKYLGVIKTNHATKLWKVWRVPLRDHEWFDTGITIKPPYYVGDVNRGRPFNDVYVYKPRDIKKSVKGAINPNIEAKLGKSSQEYRHWNQYSRNWHLRLGHKESASNVMLRLWDSEKEVVQIEVPIMK